MEVKTIKEAIAFAYRTPDSEEFQSAKADLAVEKRDKGVDVIITGDGYIGDNNTFTMQNPARIVTDVIGVKNLFRKNRPLVYKLEEGKYIIDLSTTLSKSVKDLKEIKNPRKE